MSDKSETVRTTVEAEIHFLFGFEEESDRAAAVLAHARFERWLLDTIKSRFIEMDENTANKIYRPLRHFEAKIKIAFALGLIDCKTLAGLKTVQCIRNQFAHSFELIDFSDQKIAGWCRQLDVKNPYHPDDLRHRYTTYLSEVRKDVERRIFAGLPPFR